MALNSDEIGQLASRCAGPYVGRALEMVDSQIRSATRSESWNDVQKWHQVKLRIRRMQMEDAAADRQARRQRDVPALIYQRDGRADVSADSRNLPVIWFV